ncbi:MAG: DUF2604 domain-containing protein [Usitatibacteraceae bacterium]
MADHRSDKKIEFTVVVNGTGVQVHANTNAPLASVFEKALHEAHVGGDQDPEKWEFKDAQGHVYDSDKKLSELGMGQGSIVYLSLKAGVTG